MFIASSAFSAPPTNPAAALSTKARKIIAARLVDPDSLSIRGAHIVTATVDGRSITLLCGEYNSKNRLGGYVGFDAFVLEPAVMGGVLTLNGDYQYNFFSQAGSGDFIYDGTDAALEAAAAAGRLDEETAQQTAASHRYAEFGMKYFPVCLGHS
jgi:hypothetical protein